MFLNKIALSMIAIIILIVNLLLFTIYSPYESFIVSAFEYNESVDSEGEPIHIVIDRPYLILLTLILGLTLFLLIFRKYLLQARLFFEKYALIFYLILIAIVLFLI